MSPLAPTGASLVMAVVVGVLFSTGTYLLLQRSLTRVLVGLSLLTHGANVLLLVAGGSAGVPPFLGDAAGGGGAVPDDVADPLPQAMALTAIVISFAVSAFLLALAYRSWAGTRDDAVQDDLEDRRIARLEQEEELR